MRLCVAQIRPVKGDISINIDNHNRLISLAVSNGAEIIIFPEHSITGYEPELIKDLATDKDDSRLDLFQDIADDKKLTIGVGLPTRDSRGISISMVIFQPNQTRQIYSKKYLHSSEESFFVSGNETPGLIGNKNNIALAICYEMSVPQHAEDAFNSGAQYYIASVVESKSGMNKALNRLSEVAKKYSMTVLMANCIGQTGDYDCPGRSSIWNNQGLLLGQLNDADEGILILDTDTQEVIARNI